MRAEVQFSQAIGKTIEAVHYGRYGGQAIVTFTDGTFSTIGIEHGYDRGDEEICDAKLSLFDFGDTALVEFGVIGAEELESKRRNRDKQRSRARKEQERRQYEQLRRKFECPPS